MSVTKAIRVPLVLAILSVGPVLILNDNPTSQFVGFCAFIAAMFGVAVNSSIATYHRSQMVGRASFPARSGLATVSALTWCVVGVSLAAMGFGYISYVISSENYHVMRSPPGLPGGMALTSAALSGLSCGAASLFYVASPTIHVYRTSMLFTITTLAATILWSVLSFTPFANSAAESHSAGAGLGTFLVVFAIPGIAIASLVLHVLLIHSIRHLINLSSPPNRLA